MIRWLTSLISFHVSDRSQRGRKDPAPQSQLVEGLPYMSSRSQEFVRTSLDAWETLPESERKIPSSF